MNASSSNPAIAELLAQATWLRRLAVQLVRDEHAADDLTQDTLLAALESRPRGEGSLRPWLARVLRNRVTERFRRGAALARRESEASRDEALPSSDELVARGELQRRLVEAVLGLDEPGRTLVLLRYYEGLEPTEIARRLGRPAGSVRVQLHRALARLRAHFANVEDGDDALDWRAAFLPLVESAAEVGGAAGPLASLAAPASLALMSTLLKIALPVSVLGVLAWFLGGLGAPVSSGTKGTAAPPTPVVATGPGPSGEVTEEDRVQVQHQLEERPPARASAGVALSDTPGSSRVAGSLRVARSREALRAFALELRVPGHTPEALVTDGNGRFRSEESYPGGPVQLVLLDHPEQDLRLHSGAREMERLEQPEVRSLEFVAGDELTIELDPRLELRVNLRGPPAITAALELAHLDLVMKEGLDAWRLTTPLRRDDRGAWVRFPRLMPLDLDSAAGVELGVQSADGLWAARTGAPREVRRHRRPLRLTLEPSGRLEVLVPWPGSQPDGLVVTLDHVKLTPDSGAEHERASLFASSGLEGGTYELAVWSATSEITRREVSVQPGEVRREVVELTAPDAREPLELRLTSESGGFHGIVRFAALAPDGERYSGEKVLWSEEDGVWVGRGSILAPPGDYELVPFLSNVSVPWDPSTRQVTVPGPTAELIALDGGATESLALTVLDAQTGEPLSEADVALHPGGEPVLFNRPSKQASSATFTWNDVHGPDSATWQVELEGYEPRTGDWLSATRTGDGRQLEVLLGRDS